MSLALSTCVSFILIIQLGNGAQLLNDTPLSISSARLGAASSLAPVIAIFPVTRIYA